MENIAEIEAFHSSPDLVEKLYQYSIQKNFEAGTFMLQENVA